MIKNISRETLQEICQLLGYEAKNVAEIDIYPNRIIVTTIHHEFKRPGAMPTLCRKETTHEVK